METLGKYAAFNHDDIVDKDEKLFDQKNEKNLLFKGVKEGNREMMFSHSFFSADKEIQTTMFVVDATKYGEPLQEPPQEPKILTPSNDTVFACEEKKRNLYVLTICNFINDEPTLSCNLRRHLQYHISN